MASHTFVVYSELNKGPLQDMAWLGLVRATQEMTPADIRSLTLWLQNICDKLEIQDKDITLFRLQEAVKL